MSAAISAISMTPAYAGGSGGGGGWAPPPPMPPPSQVPLGLTGTGYGGFSTSGAGVSGVTSTSNGGSSTSGAGVSGVTAASNTGPSTSGAGVSGVTSTSKGGSATGGAGGQSTSNASTGAQRLTTGAQTTSLGASGNSSTYVDAANRSSSNTSYNELFIPAVIPPTPPSSLAATTDITLTHISATLADALGYLDQPPVDVLLVDLGLPDGSGIDMIRAAQTRWPDCEVVVTTVFGDEGHVIQSIEAGAVGYLLKDDDPTRILDEIRSLSVGGSPISPLIARQILKRFRGITKPETAQPEEAVPAPIKRAPERRRPDPGAAEVVYALSAREKEVLVLITKGFTADEIAKLLQVSPHTVLTYVRRTYGKLNVKSRMEAVWEARQLGIID